MKYDAIQKFDYTNTPKVLQVKNLRVNFKSDSGLVYAVRGVSFDLYKGETLCIVGESGSGKSVTSKTIMGILANNAIVESGQILYEGEDLVRISEEEFHRIRGIKIGMIFQDPLSSLNPIVKVGKQITEATLINRNILKKHYYELISKQLVAYRNMGANVFYEINRAEEEISKIDKFNKVLSDKKLTEEKKAQILEDITEYVRLTTKNFEDEIESLKYRIAHLTEEVYENNRYFDEDIKEARLELRNERLELLNDYSSLLKDVETAEFLKLRKEYLTKLIAFFKKEKKVLNPLLKKALKVRKTDASVENKEYAAKLKEEHLEKVKILTEQIEQARQEVEFNVQYLNQEEYDLYLALLDQEQKAKQKSKKPEEINISKIGKQEEKVSCTGNVDFDNTYKKLKDLEIELADENDSYISKTKITPAEAKKMAIKVMEEVGIPLPEKRFKQYPFEFSGGMRQRIVIAIALTANPDILICDEPTTALDVTIQAQILELINRLKRERGLSCIFITHDLGVVANMADRVAVMYAGKIVEYGTSYEIFYNPKHPYTWALLSSIPDVDSKEKLDAIPGTPPDMRFPPKGDAFALRSKYALDIDFKYEPPFFKVSDTHYAATWLLHEDAPKVEMPQIVQTRIANSLIAYEKDETTSNEVLKDVIPEESFEYIDSMKAEVFKASLLKAKPKAYQDFEDGLVDISKEVNTTHDDKSLYSQTNELEGVDAENVRDSIDDILYKCTYKQELVDNNIILSVNHLKQYFFFGKGPNRYKLKAVHDVSFQIKEGECFGIVGESGCGKTTTGRSIIKLYHITSGSIYYKGYRIGAGTRWNEKEIKYTNIRYKNKIKELKVALKAGTITQEEYKQQYEEATAFKNDICEVQKAKIHQIRYDDKHVPRELMREIQMIFQDPIDSLDPRMTVEDIIQEGLRIQGFTDRKENHEKVVKILEKVGLIADYCNRYPHEFSGGQRQRIGIARALIMNPKLLICDEPISALDVSIRAQIINLLNNLKEEMGLTIMFIAHDLSVVKYFCDKIAVMYFGEIVELASSDELFKHPLHPYTKSLLSAIPKPNPLSEKNRKRIPYNPREAHDYSEEKPSFVEVTPGHFVLANTKELMDYKDEIYRLDQARILEEKEKNESLKEINDEALKADSLDNETKNEDAQVETKKEENLAKKTKTVTKKVNEAKKVTGPIMTVEEVLKLREEKEKKQERNPNHKKVYHLKKVDNKWEIILKDGKKVIKTFDTKEEGLKYGKALAESQNGTLLIHASKGKNKGKFIKE